MIGSVKSHHKPVSVQSPEQGIFLMPVENGIGKLTPQLLKNVSPFLHSVLKKRKADSSEVSLWDVLLQDKTRGLFSIVPTSFRLGDPKMLI
jgi:hypothetical protein